MMQVLSRMLPREDKFYDMLDAMVRHAHTSVAELTTLVHSDDETIQRQAGEKISAAKSAAKAELSHMNTEVCRTFVTPFDREDMQEFADRLYHIPKLNDKIQDRLLSNHLSARNDDFSRLVDVASRQAIVLDEIMTLLRRSPNLPAMNAKVETIHELEDKGDHLLGEFIMRIFEAPVLSPEVILRKDVYEMMEDVTDYYRDCANVALRIVLKHS